MELYGNSGISAFGESWNTHYSNTYVWLLTCKIVSARIGTIWRRVTIRRVR
jgi:hypothetical protein